MVGVDGAAVLKLHRAFFDALRAGSSLRRRGTAVDAGTGAGVLTTCAGFCAMRTPSDGVGVSRVNPERAKAEVRVARSPT